MTWEMLKQDTYDSGFSAGRNEGIAIGEERGRNEGIAIGEERGISLGITQGARKAKLETAKNLIDLGLPQEQIALVTGLSIEEIEKL